MKLSIKLLVLFFATSIVIVSVAGVTIYNRLRSERLKAIQESISTQLVSFDLLLRQLFGDVEADVDALSRNEAVRFRDDAAFTNFLDAPDTGFSYNYSPQEKKIIRIFDDLRKTHGHVNSVYMGRKNGAFVRSHPRTRPTRYDPRDRPWYRLAEANPDKVMKTEVYQSVTNRDLNVGVVKALKDSAGDVYGVVGMDVTLGAITDYVQNFKIRPAGNIYLVDKDNNVLAGPKGMTTAKKIDEFLGEGKSLPEKYCGRISRIIVNSSKSYLISERSAEKEWCIVAIVAARDIERMIKRPVGQMVLMLCSFLLLLSILTLAGLNHFIVRPIEKLTYETGMVGRTGNLDHRIGIAGKDEIGALAKAFNSMVGSLGQSQKALKESEKSLILYRDHLEELVRQRTGELELALDDLAKAKNRAEAADRLKSAFLATMSHELRTPLNSIIGFTGIVLQELAGPLNAEQRKQLEMVRGSAHHLLTLINDVLDISKIEAGQLEVWPKPFDLEASMSKALDVVRPMAEKKNLSIRFECDKSAFMINSDQRRVEQILLNLLNNAVKFTEKGSVTLMARFEKDGNGMLKKEPSDAHGNSASGCVRISVVDTGIGIKSDDLSKLFQPFRQIDSGLTRQHEGTGLGLAICHRLARLLGGTISVKSEHGRGCEFSLILPVEGHQTS